MTKTRILDLASKNDGLLIQFTDLVKELIDECKIRVTPACDGWVIVRVAAPPHHSRPIYRKIKKRRLLPRALVMAA